VRIRSRAVGVFVCGRSEGMPIHSRPACSHARYGVEPPTAQMFLVRRDRIPPSVSTNPFGYSATKRAYVVMFDRPPEFNDAVLRFPSGEALTE
jgi:hypothetical protein